MPLRCQKIPATDAKPAKGINKKNTALPTVWTFLVSKFKNGNMIRLLSLIFTAMVFVTCSEEDPATPSPVCSIPATVVDLRELDGCSFAFELKDGTRLLPIIVFHCGTPPLPKDLPSNALSGFDFVAGKKVLIDYTTPELYAGSCMAGQYISVTCISEATQTQTDL
jgi:hypothetical protein